MESPSTIVLVSIDDLRYDALEFSDIDDWFEEYDALQYRNTPTFDRFASEASNYTQATATSSYTPPSHASMLTGRYPKTHGVKTFFNTLSPAFPTMAEMLSDAGYETRAWIENQALEALDVTRGFDEVVCPFEEDGAHLFEFVDQALSTDEAVFLFVHLFDVHKPYCYTPGGEERAQYNVGHLERMDQILPEDVQATSLEDEARAEAQDTLSNYDELSDSLREYAHNWSLDYLVRQELETNHGDSRFEYLTKLYLAGVERFDKGRFSDLLELIRSESRSRSLLTVTSDHGEARCKWRDREDFMNSFNVSEQAVRVPLVVESDCVSIPDQCSTSVSHIDLFPSIAELADASLPSEGPGISLWSLSEKTTAERELFHESWFYEGGVDFFGNIDETGEGALSEVAVRNYPYKATVSRADTGNPDVALYDLSVDPFERNPIDPADDPGDLESSLELYLENVDMHCSSDLDSNTSVELEDRLRALGYLD